MCAVCELIDPETGARHGGKCPQLFGGRRKVELSEKFLETLRRVQEGCSGVVEVGGRKEMCGLKSGHSGPHRSPLQMKPLITVLSAPGRHGTPDRTG